MIKRKKAFLSALSGLLACSVMLTGCNSADNAAEPDVTDSVPAQSHTDAQIQTENNGIENADPDSYSVSEIKRAYGESENKDIMPLYNVEPWESFDFDFKFNWEELIGMGIVDLVTVHTHPDCLPQSQIYTYNTQSETETGGTRINVAPITGTLATDSETDDMLDNDIDTWGNAPMYYIAVHYDMDSDTLQKLDAPLVIPFTVKHELPVPTLKGAVDSTGRFKLVWEAVEGADSYNVYSYGNADRNRTGSINEPVAGAESAFDVNGDCYLAKEANTEETEFDCFAGKDHGLAIHYHDELDDDDTDYILGQNYSVNGSYFVTAVFGDKESRLSNIVNTSDMILPHKVVDGEDIMFSRFESESDLPHTLKVLNIDGSITERNVIYSFHRGKTLLGTDYPHFRYSVEGTAITGEVSMDIAAVEGGADYYSDLQEGDPPRGFVSNSSNSYVKIEPENNTKFNPDSGVPTIIEADGAEEDEGLTLVERQRENTEKHIENADSLTVDNARYTVFADSAGEEWLACNLMAGNTQISLEPFPSLQQFDNLADVFQKVYYQNPYILGILAYAYDYGTLTLNAKYCYDKNEILQRQQEIYLRSKEIADQCVTDGMNDEEKCRALYNYLNDNTVYDEQAVEEAEKNNFKKDENWKEAEDAFNAYGIIVKKTGVCQSYALSYKLLCSLCNVESKVITGYLNGSLPHAWSAVKLDGDWYQIDCTNNETNCGIPFFLYAAGKDDLYMTGYTEDKLYELDTAVGSYAVADSDKEYYEVNGLAAGSVEELKAVLSNCLESSAGSVAIRYTSELPSQREIAMAVLEVYHMKGMEDKLETLGLGCAGCYIILVQN
ncbi:MAG: hypothetical protein NC228_08010 [[Eubacterium] siraeum]|nr:hypothetical protein [[Eubacterium] siraeum]